MSKSKIKIHNMRLNDYEKKKREGEKIAIFDVLLTMVKEKK